MLDNRIMYFYLGTGVTPSMVNAPVGKGSAYAFAATDSQNRYFDGGKTYSVTMPGPVPAKDFWSFVVYDGQTRSLLETDQVTGGEDHPRGTADSTSAGQRLRIVRQEIDGAVKSP